MMLALEATTSVLDRKLQQPQQTATEKPQRWAMRRWSLHGTADTRTKTSKESAPPAPPPTSSKSETAKTTPPPPPPLFVDADKEKRKRSRSVDMSPLQTSLKKAPTALTAKLAQCVEAMGLRDALHRYKKSGGNSSDGQDEIYGHTARKANSKGHRVHFPSSPHHFKQTYEYPVTTVEEKKECHYSRHELLDMVVEAKECLARERRFCSQPDNTIFEQGYLTLPNELHFFHHKRYYCLLKARELLCYSSPAHACKNVNLKCKIPILKVQECSTMSNQAKIAAFGAHLPPSLPLMFFVTRADGERVLFAAETRCNKKSWVHTLLRLTQVQEDLPPCLLRDTSTTSSASTCTSEEESGHSSSDDDEDDKEDEKRRHNETLEDSGVKADDSPVVDEWHESNNAESRTLA